MGMFKFCSVFHLSSYLAKTDDIKVYGYERVLEPLLKDLATLEHFGVFISQLGHSVKGTVQSVVADNLGAHGLAGFVERFSGHYICRFCTAQKSEIQCQDVKSGAYPLRTRDIHKAIVVFAEKSNSNYCGVKRRCILSESLAHFDVSTGYPPDIAHNLFEGIVLVELAKCLNLLISKKYFTLDSLNSLIRNFLYKQGDKTNRPHVIQRTFSSKKTIGGNAHENWNLLRLIPFLVCSYQRMSLHGKSF